MAEVGIFCNAVRIYKISAARLIILRKQNCGAHIWEENDYKLIRQKIILTEILAMNTAVLCHYESLDGSTVV